LEWTRAIRDRLREVDARDGDDAVYEAQIGEVLGEGAWESFPHEVRRILTPNGPAALLVAAAESPPPQPEMTEAMAGVLPNARTALVAGGHLIDPAGPEVLAFVGEVVEGR
jgi:esterase